MHALTGGCHCGGLHVQVELTRSPGGYHPRACDCDFCRKHAAAWVSDPEGRLRLEGEIEAEPVIYRQGSGQAELMLCGRCGVLVAALYRRGEELYAAVNARALEVGAAFGEEQPVSPKSLSEGQKGERWRKLWFCDVTVHIGPIPAAALQP